MQEGQAVPDFKIRNDKDEEVSQSDFHGPKCRSIFLSQRQLPGLKEGSNRLS